MIRTPCHVIKTYSRTAMCHMVQIPRQQTVQSILPRVTVKLPFDFDFAPISIELQMIITSSYEVHFSPFKLC